MTTDFSKRTPTAPEGDYRSTPHPDAVNRWAEGTLYEWVTCDGCGKEYQREVLIEDMRDSFVKWCAICSMERQEAQDMCPEGVVGPGFGSACCLPFRHTGRCQPFTLDADEVRQKLAARDG